MKIESSYPVICTDNLSAARAFYSDYFDYDITFETDWYISLKTKAEPGHELALLDYRHSSLPEGFRQPARGVLINLEVSDVDEVYAQLKAKGLTMVLDLKSEPWGQRHFITQDPN
ncbi:MAG: VOC family protein, partial [Desulfosarcina sp.]